jgi:hypothetical protein
VITGGRHFKILLSLAVDEEVFEGFGKYPKSSAISSAISVDSPGMN